MDDKKIIALFWERSESAITQTAKKYGKFCYRIAYNILSDHQHSEECVNDTYIRTWDIIPPERPQKLMAFLGKITRNLALNRFQYERAQKRYGATVPMEELENSLSGCDGEEVLDRIVLRDALNAFLAELSVTDRKLFLRRYWYFSDIREIAGAFAMTEGQVKMRLHRLRTALRKRLEQEGLL